MFDFLYVVYSQNDACELPGGVGGTSVKTLAPVNAELNPELPRLGGLYVSNREYGKEATGHILLCV